MKEVTFSSITYQLEYNLIVGSLSASGSDMGGMWLVHRWGEMGKSMLLLQECLERRKIPYVCTLSFGTFNLKWQRFIDHEKYTKLQDIPIRGFTDKEKALIMRYKIEGGG